MTTVDGNALGGLLWEVFGREMTATTGTCASCGMTGPLAGTVVYRRGPGVVMRCHRCEGLLMVIVEFRGRYCVDTSGFM
jgi:Family of unknown function (DUF6510)